ncbi:MAG: ATP synthase F1 subunit gamma [Actinomycetota bacterium]
MTREKEIKDRIESIAGTRKITGAMGMIASSRIRAAQKRLIESRPFIRMVEDFLCNLGLTGPIQNDPLVRKREAEKTVLILGVTADKGLCGAYNANVIELIEENTERFLAQGKDVEMDMIGTRGKSYFTYRGYELKKVYEHLSYWPKFMDAREISRNLISRYVVGEADRVLVCYTRYINPASQEAAVMQILPIPIAQKLSEREKGIDAAGPFECRPRDLPTEFEYEPSLEEIVRSIIPEYIFTVVYGILLESTASEIGARMTAMRNASSNSDDLLRGLTKDYHKFRQHQITSEIMEVVSGGQTGG